MQTILSLFCSPNKKGYTSSLLNLYLKDYIKKLHDEVEVKTILVYNKCILPCIGCLKCENNGKCPLNEQDDLEDVFNEIEIADHIIIATPIYFNGYPSPFKSIIDRTQQIYIKKKINNSLGKKLKKGSLVATCGSNNKSSFDGIIITTKMFFNCMDCGFVGKLFASGCDKNEKIEIFD